MVKTKDLLPVYGLIAVLIHGWSLYRFFWMLPAWLNFLTVGEIIEILFYTFAVSFLDSLIILAVLILVSFLLPSTWLRENFIVRGGLLVFCLLGFAIYLAYKMIPVDRLGGYFVGALILIVVLQLLVARIHWLSPLIAAIADRSIIFLYIYVPLSVAGILGVFLLVVW